MRAFITTHEALACKAEHIEPKDVPFCGVHPDAVVSYFDEVEVEDNAAKLVSFFKSQGSWAPFEPAAFLQFCARDRGWQMPPAHGKGMFYGLVKRNEEDDSPFPKPNFLQLMEDGRIGVTDEFILRCKGTERAAIDAFQHELAA